MEDGRENVKGTRLLTGCRTGDAGVLKSLQASLLAGFPCPHLLATPLHGTWAGPVHPELLEPPVLLSGMLCPRAYHVPGMGGRSEAHPTDGPFCPGARVGGV